MALTTTERNRKSYLDQPLILRKRIREFLGLFLGLRRHDFRAARTFMNTQWPDRPRHVRVGKFLVWALGQMWNDIPSALRHTSFARPVSKVPVWLADGNPLANHPWSNQPTAELPKRADVVVIGAGLAGCAMAYHWGRRASRDQHLVLLEMHEVASGSAGRNEGLVVMGRYFHMVYKTVLQHLPEARPDLNQHEHAQLAWQFAAAYCRGCYRNADLIESTVRREGFDCDYAREGWVQAHEHHEQAALSESVQRALDSRYDDWTSITPQKVEELTGMRVRHNAGFSLAAASFHPAKWCWCLVRRALESGSVQLFSRTKVLQVQDAGEDLLVRTKRGSIRARHVVNCTESYTPLLHRQFSGFMRPTQTQATTGQNGPAVMKPHVGISSSHAFFGRHGKSVMVGTDATRVPDRQAGRVQPSRFLTKFCIAEMEQRFGPSEYHVTNEWSGTVTYTPDEYPVVGLMDGNQQYIIGGMAGSGTAVGFNASRCVVNQLLGCTDEPDDFPLEYFSPMRLLSPRTHNWPALENGEADNPASVVTEWR